jgi:outer membrane protein assembly factor BamB
MWRGPQQNGISEEQGLPLHWSGTENIAWRLALPGVAPSTPIIWEDMIFLTSTDHESDRILLLGVDTAGTQLWQRTIGQGESEQREKNNLASASPCTDGQHVWTFTGNGTVSCFDLAGNEKWHFNVEDRYEKVDMPWSMASSPTPYGRLLYLQLLHLNSSRVIAVDKTTGTEVWNVERQTDARGKCMRSYATPVVYRDDQREYLLTHGQDYIVAHDLNNGRELWRCGDFHPRSGYDPMMHMASSPVVGAGIILVPSGYHGNFQVLRPDGAGDITGDATYRLWNDYISPRRPSALMVDSLAYVGTEKGALYCLDVKTGKQHYRRPIHRHTHHASPVYADGRIYFTARDGTVTVVKPGTDFEILATNSLDETISASPAISGGRIYLRTFAALYAIENR